MNFRCILSLYCLFLSVEFFAQRIERVHCEYVFTTTENVSLQTAKQIAIEKAKIQAIAEKFGTSIQQQNTTYINNKTENGNTSSKIDFNSISMSEVRGEWIETTSEPRFSEPVYDRRGNYSISVSFTGTVRELVSSKISVDYSILCNGVEKQHARNKFKNGDDLFLSFKSPVDGYLIVYLIDPYNETAYCLLPYSQSSLPNQLIKHDKQYIFFSTKHEEDESKKCLVDEYNLTTQSDYERNDIVIIFSPKKITKSNSEQKQADTPRELTIKEFEKWIGEIKRKDADAIDIRESIEIFK